MKSLENPYGLNYKDLTNVTIPEDYRDMDPWNNPYDPYGRGASPRTALLFEALANAISPSGGITNRISTTDLINKDMYAVNPNFLSEEYSGSGTSVRRGPLRGNILLNNVDRSWQWMLKEIMQHEMIHKKTGGMGGIQWGNKIPAEDTQKADMWLRSLGEDPRSYPQERMAYSLGRMLKAPRKYYIQGDLKRASPDYLSDWKYANKE